MLDRAGLRVLRLNLDAFITSDPITITLTRLTRVKTANGGFKKEAPAFIGPQTFRLTPFKRRLSNFTTNTQDGDIPRIEYIMTGRWDADIERWDEFTYNGDQFMVVSIERKSDDRAHTDRVTAQVSNKAEGLIWQTKVGSSS